MSRARQALRWILRGLAALVVVVLIAAAGGALWLRGRLNGSLPAMQGEVALAGLSAPVRIEFDALGIPTITAASRLDAARATGFLHAQNRFFQMDLLRRQAAGELSELIGPATLSRDREARLHRFRAKARRDVEEASGAERSLIEAYTAGVNAGLQALASPPFEYLLLRTQPRPWAPEDCVLANLSMFMVLHGGSMERESALGLMHDLLPGPLFEYLSPPGSPWDAPIVGAALPQPPLPGPDVLDLRRSAVASTLHDVQAWTGEEPDEAIPGSNNWAVAGKLTATGAAIVANDMHLPITVPNTWYRVSIICPGAGGTNRITGVTLPGTPITVVGSNGKIAWGFTNTEGDWMDLVELDPAPGDAESYLTPKGPQRLEHHDEVIPVKGAAAEHLDVVETIWGPVVDTDHKGRKRALRWTAHDTEATNIGLLAMETAATLEEAQRAGNLSGIPPQNLMVATADGRIGWSIAGRIPRRVGFDGRLPGSWADGSRRWDGYLAPEEYPRVNDPPSGRLWTANARVVDGAMLRVLGDGGYDFGARAGQIRDNLMALTRASEKDMLSIQLDDRALYMKRWRDLLLAALTPDAVAGHPLRAELRGFLERWGDRAAIDSVGYRMTRVSAINIERLIYEPLTAACKRADEGYQYSQSSQYHGVAMALLDQRPPHLLEPQYASWDALILAGVDAGLDFVMADKRPLAAHTWGDRNTTRVQHPISLGVPMLSRWLDMPARQLPGDAWMPRVQGIAFGASERFAVSPGHEEDGYFHMPCGQSGHPLSPYYGDGHDAWAEGRMTSFLPGPAASTLTLVPRS